MPYTASWLFAPGKNVGGMWAVGFEDGGGCIFPERAYISSLGAEADLGESDSGGLFAETSWAVSPAAELVEGAEGV